MTRRQLAKRLHDDIQRHGAHLVNGTMVWRTVTGSWGGLPGLQQPPEDSTFFEWIGWHRLAKHNTVLAIETRLKKLERKHEGHSPRIDRRSIKKA